MRGVSPVVATILLLVMVVAITAGVFYFFRTVVGTAAGKGTVATTTAITQAEVQANVRIVNWFEDTASGNLSLEILNNLDKTITIKRVTVDGSTKTLTTDNTINSGDVKAIITNYKYTDVKKGETKVVIYLTYDNKLYAVESILG